MFICQQMEAVGHLQVGEDDLDQALTSAVVCCILAAAGPQRSRVLANLYKDERCARLPVFSFLEKVYLERILRRQEVTLLIDLSPTHPPSPYFYSSHTVQTPA